MCDINFLLLTIIIFALIFDFTNGVHDSANAIATIVSTRVLSPRIAVSMAAILNLIGALLGTEVAKTLGSGLVQSEVVMGSQLLVLAALCAAIIWNCITWYFGIPSSSSHALIGGLMGSAIAYAGTDALQIQNICTKVIIPLFLAPFLGFVAGFSFMWLVYWLFSHFRRRNVNNIFKRLQYCSAASIALSHGLNDAQKTMGIITLALFIFGYIDSIAVPLWVKISCALAMALGTGFGGWKIVRTMGGKIFRIEPVHGFTAECSATIVLTTASLLGSPVSTSQTISSAIFGVGSTLRLKAVRWSLAKNLLIAWVLTIPAAVILGFLLLKFLTALQQSFY